MSTLIFHKQQSKTNIKDYKVQFKIKINDINNYLRVQSKTNNYLGGLS